MENFRLGSQNHTVDWRAKHGEKISRAELRMRGNCVIGRGGGYLLLKLGWAQIGAVRCSSIEYIAIKPLNNDANTLFIKINYIKLKP